MAPDAKPWTTVAWQRGKQFLDDYGYVVLPMQWAVGAFIGLIIGPGLLGYISEYATYRFALYEGIRPPLEGIPYLQTAVITSSFVFTLLCALGFILTLSLARLTLWWITAMLPGLKGFSRFLPSDKLGLGPHFHELSFLRVCVIGLIIGIGFNLYIFIISFPIFAFEENITINLRGLIPMAIAAMFLGFLVTLLFWRKVVAWWIAALAAICIFVGALVVMFKPDYYGLFLRHLRYGGGIPMIVELDQPGAVQSVEYSANLVLRTSAALLMFEPASGTIREIPIARVKSLKHPANLPEMGHILPSLNKVGLPADGQARSD